MGLGPTPLPKGKKQKLKEPEGRARWLSQEEAAALLGAAQQERTAAHLPEFIRLALNTGCRSGELLGLEWDRVDLKNNLVHLEGRHTKSHKRRSVPINECARRALLNRARFKAQNCPASPWVFCREDGSQIVSVRRSFSTACRKAGIKDFRIHDMRHTFAAWLVSDGVPLTEVRDLLGHSTVKVTERYAHLAPENLRTAVARLDNVTQFGHVFDLEREVTSVTKVGTV